MKKVSFIIFIIAPSLASSVMGQSKTFSSSSLDTPATVMRDISETKALAAILDENNYLTLSTVGHERSRLYLNNFSASSRLLVDEVPFRYNFSVRVSDDRKYVSYFVKDDISGREVGKVYDVESRKLFVIKRSDGDVSGLYISSTTGRLSYQLRNYGHVTQLYISDLDGSNPKFVAEALSGPWSPDGKWFLARRVSSHNIHPKEKLRAGTITNEEFNRISKQRRQGIFSIPLFWVFDASGTPQLELNSFDKFAEGIWSPDSKRLAILTTDGEIHVVEFFITSSGTLVMKDSKLCARSEANFYLTTPIWSPDCTQLLSVKCEMDQQGRTVLNSEILIINPHGAGISQVLRTPQIFVEKLLMWSVEGDLYFVHRTPGSENVTVSKIRAQ